MADEFALHLDNPTKTFNAGDEITGKVVLSCSSNCEAKGIRVKLEGKEAVTIGGGNSRYVANQTLMNEEIYLVGDGQSDLTILAGSYEYPCKFVLPKNLPSSFASAFGNVSYAIEAMVLKPWHSFNKKRSEVIVTVKSTGDLKDFPDALIPAEISNSKTLSCLCYPSGSVVASIEVPQKGYTSGETIQFEAEVQNASFRIVKKVQMVLVQEIAYGEVTFWGSRPMVVKNDIAVAERDGISSGESDVWTGGLICVPELPPTSVGSHIVDFQYFLRLKVCIARTPWNLEVNLPLIIGSKIPDAFEAEILLD